MDAGAKACLEVKNLRLNQKNRTSDVHDESDRGRKDRNKKAKVSPQTLRIVSYTPEPNQIEHFVGTMLV